MGDENECLDVGALQTYANGPTTFAVQSRYRAKAREVFVRWGLVNESDALHCEELHLWLEKTKLGTLSSTAEKHAQANTDCNGALVPD